jgi:hypothetical protein
VNDRTKSDFRKKKKSKIAQIEKIKMKKSVNSFESANDSIRFADKCRSSLCASHPFAQLKWRSIQLRGTFRPLPCYGIAPPLNISPFYIYPDSCQLYALFRELNKTASTQWGFLIEVEAVVAPAGA